LSAELASWRQKLKELERDAENSRKDAEEAAAVLKLKDLEVEDMRK